jgi:hypothetical protein
MSIYRKAIAVYGLLVLFIAILFLIGGAWYGLHRVRSERREIQTAAQEARRLESEIDAARAKLKGRKECMEVWEQCLHGEVAQNVNRVLQEVMEPYRENELKQIALGRPSSKSALAGGTENSYSRFEVVFEGSYGPMQEVLVQLETRMPNLVLEELLVEPAKSAKSLSFRAIFTCWSMANRTPVS